MLAPDLTSLPGSEMSSNERAQRILDSLNTAVLTCDRDLVVMSINPAGEMLFGVSANHIVHRSLMDVCGSDHESWAPLFNAIHTGQPVTAHGMRLTLSPETTIGVDYTATPLVRWDGEEHLILELIHVDQFLRLAREDTLVDAHAAKRAVIRGLAHEIKNPLGGLRGAAQLLDRELPDRRYREYTRIIIHEADRLRKLVDRMMGSYRPIRTEPVNIHQVLEHVCRLVQAEKPDGLTIRQDYDPSLPELEGDREQLVQAVLNIVRNAVEAMDGDGRIFLRTRVKRFMRIGNVLHRRVIRVDIEDDGPGVPENLREQIFYPMVTGRAEGTGLGLSIAHDIVGRHGGLIEFTTESGLTRFTVYLPFTNKVTNS
jgi:two-component system nitrogen regulation sensor histidine kinase GlnL